MSYTKYLYKHITHFTTKLTYVNEFKQNWALQVNFNFAALCKQRWGIAGFKLNWDGRFIPPGYFHLIVY